MNTTYILAIASIMAASTATPGIAQTTSGAATTAVSAPTVTAGATVYDPAGGVVGTVGTVTADAVVIATGTHDVAVPPTAVGAGPKGLTMAMTKVQLDAAFVQQQAQATAAMKAQLVPGAAVFSRNGTEQVGTIKVTDAQTVTLTTSKGGAVQLPIDGFSTGPKGIIIGMTAAEFNAAIAAPAKK